MTVGEKIREARKRNGKSAEWLAKEIGCSQSTISQLERGIRNPSARMIRLIADALSCRVADLVTAEYIRAENVSVDWDVFAPWESINTISEDEQLRFSITFEKLNSEGRRRVFELMEDLAEISRYRIDFGE